MPDSSPPPAGGVAPPFSGGLKRVAGFCYGHGVVQAGELTMADYKRGSMDIASHEKTYDGFLRFSAWVCLLVLFILVFLAIFNS